MTSLVAISLYCCLWLRLGWSGLISMNIYCWRPNFFNCVESVACGFDTSAPVIMFLTYCLYYRNHMAKSCDLPHICVFLFSNARGGGCGYYSLFPVVISLNYHCWCTPYILKRTITECNLCSFNDFPGYVLFRLLILVLMMVPIYIFLSVGVWLYL